MHIKKERRNKMKINVFKMQILMGEKGLTIKKLAELSECQGRRFPALYQERAVHRRWHIKLLQF